MIQQPDKAVHRARTWTKKGVSVPLAFGVWKRGKRKDLGSPLRWSPNPVLLGFYAGAIKWAWLIKSMATAMESTSNSTSLPGESELGLKVPTYKLQGWFPWQPAVIVRGSPKWPHSHNKRYFTLSHLRKFWGFRSSGPETGKDQTGISYKSQWPQTLTVSGARPFSTLVSCFGACWAISTWLGKGCNSCCSNFQRGDSSGGVRCVPGLSLCSIRTVTWWGMGCSHLPCSNFSQSSSQEASLFWRSWCFSEHSTYSYQSMDACKLLFFFLEQ